MFLFILLAIRLGFYWTYPRNRFGSYFFGFFLLNKKASSLTTLALKCLRLIALRLILSDNLPLSALFNTYIYFYPKQIRDLLSDSKLLNWFNSYFLISSIIFNLEN